MRRELCWHDVATAGLTLVKDSPIVATIQSPGALARFARSIARSASLWGSVVSIGFYGLYHGDVLGGEFFRRYFAGHPVNYTETICFFVALAALVIKALDLAGQWPLLAQISLGPKLAEPQSPSDAEGLRAKLAALPIAQRETYLAGRLDAGLAHVARQGSADNLEDELKFLADQDASRAAASYGLVKIIIWAIPILGFLGTVIGITMAIASLSPDALEKSLPDVTAGLGVAFDTTALALALSMVLMFVQFWTDRAERRLLDAVDQRAVSELLGRFAATGAANDPAQTELRGLLASAMSGVLAGVERTVERQAEVWQRTIDAAHERWASMVAQSQTQIETALETALSRSLAQHAVQMAESSRRATDENRATWQPLQDALLQAADALRQQQVELVRQGDVLLEVVDATGQVAQLEATLNRNLQALAGAQNFEETLHSLSAAIHLMCARLGSPAPGNIDLARKRQGSQAA